MQTFSAKSFNGFFIWLLIKTKKNKRVIIINYVTFTLANACVCVCFAVRKNDAFPVRAAYLESIRILSLFFQLFFSFGSSYFCLFVYSPSSIRSWSHTPVIRLLYRIRASHALARWENRHFTPKSKFKTEKPNKTPHTQPEKLIKYDWKMNVK